MTQVQWCSHSPRARKPRYKVKWAVGRITTKKGIGGDGIRAELLKILKDNSVIVMCSMHLENSVRAMR